MKRPLYVVGFTFAGCLLFAAVAGFHAACAALLVCVILFAVALTATKWYRKEAFWAVLFSAVTALSLFCAREYLVVRPLWQMHGQTVSATVQITEEVVESERAVAYFAKVQEGELPADTKLLLWVRADDNTPELYEQLTGSLYLEKTDAFRAEGVYLTAWAQDEWAVSAAESLPRGAAFHAWRQRVIDFVDQRAEGDVGALIRAVCFGDKSRLSSEIVQHFRNAGLSHLMAVSGLHVTTVAMAVFAVLCFIGVRRRTAALFSMPIPLMFAALTGFSYSALRAAAMFTFMLCGMIFRRQADGRNSLGGGLLILLLIDPNAVCDLGLQLSATATLGILLSNAWVSRKPDKTHGFLKRQLHKLGGSLLVTVAAVLATLPITALSFGWVAVLSPLSNLMAQPATSVVLIGGCLGTLLLAVPGLGFLASPLFLAAGSCARYLLWVAEWISELPLSVKLLSEPHLMILCCATPFLLAVGWHLVKGRGLRMAAMLSVVAFAVSGTVYTLGMRGVTTITAAHIEDGAVVLLQRDGHAALVVAGDGSTAEAAQFLELKGIDRLDFILYTETVHDASRLLPAADAVYAAVGDKRAESIGAGATLTFWGDSRARLKDGWLWLDLGQTRVLLCPEQGDTANLTAEERRASLVLFDNLPPRHAAGIGATQGVLCCAEDQVAYLNKALPTGDYPIAITYDFVSIKTRGRGDLYIGE